MTTTHIDLSNNVRNDVIAILNGRLADAIDLGRAHYLTLVR